MGIRSIGVATVIAAVSLAAPGSSGTVSRCETVTVGSAVVVRSECTASAGLSAVGTEARAGEGVGEVVDVLSGMLAGLPGLADRVAQTIPTRQFGSWILLMHF
jgi:hypothetical protein